MTRANKQGYRKFFPVNENGEEIPTNLNIKGGIVFTLQLKPTSESKKTLALWSLYRRKKMKCFICAWKIETANTTMDKDDTGQDIPILRKQPKWGINTNEMEVNLARNIWIHKSRPLLEKIAREYQTKLTGDLNSCEGCGMAMAKRKAIAKTTMVSAKKFGERMYGDTAGPFTATLGGNRYICCCWWFIQIRVDWFRKEENDVCTICTKSDRKIERIETQR